MLLKFLGAQIFVLCPSESRFSLMGVSGMVADLVAAIRRAHGGRSG
jgi:hypothetical protein